MGAASHKLKKDKEIDMANSNKVVIFINGYTS